MSGFLIDIAKKARETNDMRRLRLLLNRANARMLDARDIIRWPALADALQLEVDAVRARIEQVGAKR